MLTTFAAALPSTAVRAEERGSSRMRVYVGTYNREAGEGIHVFDFDAQTGKMGAPRLAAEVGNPSFVAIHPDGKTLYSVGVPLQGERNARAGSVFAYRIDPATGDLTLLNAQSSGGAGPCHVSVDATGKTAVVANYGGGSIASLPIQEDGALQPAASFFQHSGSSAHPTRQTAAHAHSVNFSLDNRFVVAADLGLDQLLVYALNPETGELAPHDPPFVRTTPGAGPRHFAFHPQGQFAYNNDELSSSVTAYRYDAETGTLSPLGTVSTLPDGFDGNNTTAECLVHPHGRFVYVSNRGHNSIAVFRVLPDGALAAAGHIPSQGEIPRNFNIDPSGRWMLIANQDSNNIVACAIDPESGLATPTEGSVMVSRPVCLKFLQVE